MTFLPLPKERGMNMKLAANEFEFIRCDEDSLEEICAIQEEAFRTLDNPELLRRNSKEVLHACLMEPHTTLGAYYGGRMAAFAVLYVAKDSTENLGRDIGVTEEELSTVANVKLVIVRKEFRGNGLQKLLTQRLEEFARDQGIQTLCATVSPANDYSIRNFEALGYRFYACKTKYGNLKRNIYVKSIVTQK